MNKLFIFGLLFFFFSCESKFEIVFLKKRSAENPYFALQITDAELLTK